MAVAERRYGRQLGSCDGPTTPFEETHACCVPPERIDGTESKLCYQLQSNVNSSF